ncbi:MAG: SUMF1/EgtB/PvdO family nonheme iron enzyme, partial [Verrucomicrobia bacterium]|nr:SUMF1/EgtB/PvdO family nonheme iron enzyme [Verrucomicrobiota bacterium]
NAFQCAGLLSVTLPEGVTEIGDEAFDYCYDMRTVTLGSKVTSIGNYAFSRCSSLTGITLPGSLTTIGNYAFKGCRMMESITIPDSVTTMGAGIFKECAGLLNITLPNKLTTIKANMFSGCVNLTSIVIPDSVTGIDSYAFENCERMKEVTFSANLEIIQSSAFTGCRYLTKVTLPATLTSMGYSVFKDCVRLTEVYYEGDNPSAGLLIYDNTPDNLLSYYPTGNATWLERIEDGKWRDRGVATWDPEPRPPGPTGDFSYTYEDGVLILYFTGTLCQSVDAVHWTELPSATSPYRVALKDKKSFFCAKSGSTPPASKDITIPLASGVDLTLIWIEPGTFMMGSPENEFGRFTDEDLHQVTLTKGYWVGKYEVTQAQYEAILGASANYSKFKDPSRPVECIFWSEATNFCAKLTEIERAAGRLPEGYEYSLPTEAQWEYACRAGTTTGLYSGKENTSTRGVCPNVDEIAWYDQNSGSQTHVVGQKLPNAWGLYDMAGNVAEWCLDWKGAYPGQAVTDPTGPETGTFRVVRGGDWDNYAQFCRSAARHSNQPGFCTSSIGFRVALVATTSSETSGLPVPGSNASIVLPDNVGLDLIWINPGTFTMGSPEDELGRFSDEAQHEVTLTKGYWLGKYEITQAQYKAIMKANPSSFIGADLPVECVSWNDAKEFCKKLTEIEKAAGRLPTGYEYTLPTEAQWEYACRAGTTTALNSGKNLSDKYECPEMDEVGWYYYNSNYKTYLVGQKQPNAWGLYDMHGNVFEWCLDWYVENYPTSSVTDPKGPSTGSYRVLRGGSWYDRAYYCRSASRRSRGPSSIDYFSGFRVALSLVQ